MNLRGVRPWILAGLCACGGERTPDPAPQDPPPPPSGDPGDELVLELTGASVWHTLSREATGPSGERCLERTLEIRREGVPPVRVPLLYTRDVPRVIDDSTLEARVYLNCAPGDRYRIDTRTGQPTPLR
jgi:hypothetical protein